MADAIRILVPERVVPAHVITRCCDCPYWVNHGAAYGDGDTCSLDDNLGRTTPSSAIPGWCPHPNRVSGE